MLPDIQEGRREGLVKGAQDLSVTEGPSISVPYQPQTHLPPLAKPEPREREEHSQMGRVKVSLAGLLGHP